MSCRAGFWVPNISTLGSHFPVVCWGSVLSVVPQEVSLSVCEYTYALCVYCVVEVSEFVYGCERLVAFLNEGAVFM